MRRMVERGREREREGWVSVQDNRYPADARQHTHTSHHHKSSKVPNCHSRHPEKPPRPPTLYDRITGDRGTAKRSQRNP